MVCRHMQIMWANHIQATQWSTHCWRWCVPMLLIIMRYYLLKLELMLYTMAAIRLFLCLSDITRAIDPYSRMINKVRYPILHGWKWWVGNLSHHNMNVLLLALYTDKIYLLPEDISFREMCNVVNIVNIVVSYIIHFLKEAVELEHQAEMLDYF